MSDAVFPTLPGLSWNVVRQPEFHTKIQKAISGRELRLAFMSSPMYTFKMTFEVLRQDWKFSELKKLCGFFLERMGSFDSFLYSDLGDNSVTNQQIGIGDGSTAVFQLVRAYGPDNTGFVEQIHNPRLHPGDNNVLNVENIFDVHNVLTYGPLTMFGNPIIYVDGVELGEDVDYTLGPAGTVNFLSAPAVGAVVTWTGGYYYRVRFNMDAAEFNEFMQNLWELKKCELYGSLVNKV